MAIDKVKCGCGCTMLDVEPSDAENSEYNCPKG